MSEELNEQSEEKRTTLDETKDAEPGKKKQWLKSMGVGAFLFFTIKGLVWLAVFFGLFKACN